MNEEDHPKASFKTVYEIIEKLEHMESSERLHVWQTVATWFKIPTAIHPSSRISAHTTPPPSSPIIANEGTIPPANSFSFSQRDDISPKDFLNEKMPTTDVERVACLAYYLTHYRDTPDFKTIDITKLNTEAAQRKLSNPTEASKNALKGNYLAASSKKGCRQLSAMGEQYVNALPDRDEANSIRRKMNPRKTRKAKATPVRKSESAI